MKSYVAFDLSYKIIARVKARDLAHAMEKFSAIHGQLPEHSQVMSFADFTDAENTAKEMMRWY